MISRSLFTTAIRVIAIVSASLIITTSSQAFTLLSEPRTHSTYDHAESHTQPQMREEQTNSRINEKKLGVVRVIMSDGSSLHVVQQPPGNHGYVSSRSETLTQFNDAECYDTIGFLAHNDLAGQHILDLEINKNLQVTFDDGSIRLFRVTNIQAYRALSPSSPHSNFVNLDDIETTLSSSELFRKIYTAKGRLIFQTCIASEGRMNWGRIFVTARPLVVPQHWHGPTMFASHMSKYGNFASSLSSDGRASTP